MGRAMGMCVYVIRPFLEWTSTAPVIVRSSCVCIGRRSENEEDEEGMVNDGGGTAQKSREDCLVT